MKKVVRVDAKHVSMQMVITDMKARCDCGWEGTVGECEPDDDGDGDLLCPECLKLATIIYIAE